MATHGSESYFVIGEGLLSESVGGRERTLAAALEADTPPFRFSRMGPSGLGKQLGEPNMKKIAAAMVAGAGGQSTIPAGFTYLGQFVDHDLTFDKTEVMLGDNVAPIDLLQGRSPSLDLDSLYGGGPNDPESAKFYEADGLHLKMGKTETPAASRRKQGFDLPRGAGSTAAEKRKAIIPDQRNDENLAVAQLHLAMIRFHNRVVDTLAGLTSRRRSASPRSQKVVKHYQWMLKTDYLPRICAPGVVNDVFNQGRKLFEVGAPATDVPTMPIEFSVAAFRLGHSMIRDAYNWNVAFDNGAGTSTTSSSSRRRAASSAAVRAWRPTGPRTSAGSSTSARPAASRPSSCPRRSSTARCASTRSSRTRSPRFRASRPGVDDQPRLPEPDAGEDGQARDRPADGDVPEEQGRHRHEADQCADPRRQQRCQPERPDRGAAHAAARSGRRSGSTSCARRSSTAAS